MVTTLHYTGGMFFMPASFHFTMINCVWCLCCMGSRVPSKKVQEMHVFLIFWPIDEPGETLTKGEMTGKTQY